MNVDPRTKASRWRWAFGCLLLLGVSFLSVVPAEAQSTSQSAIEWECVPIIQGFSLAYSSDSKTIIVGGVGGVQLVDTATRAQRSLPTTPGSDFNALALSSDGKSLALGGNDLEVWNLGSGKQIGTLAFPGVNVVAIAYSPDGKRLAASGFGLTFNGPYQPPTYSSVVQIYDANSLELVGNTLYPTGSDSNCVVFSKDSQYLIEAGSASTKPVGLGYVNVWNASTGLMVSTLATQATASVKSVALSSDGTQLAVAGSNTTGAVLEVWDWQQGTLTRSIPVPVSIQLNSVSWSIDQKQLAISGNQPIGNGVFDTVAVVQTWTASTGTLAHNFDVSASLNSQFVTFSPDGKTMANCQGSSSSSDATSPGGFLKFWRTSSGALEASVDTIGSYGASTVVFSSDGSVVAQPRTSPAGNTIRILNASSGELIWSLPSEVTTGFGPIAYSETGGYLADAGILTTQSGSVHKSSGLIEIRKGITSLSRFSLKSSANVSIASIGFSNDGTELAVGGKDAGGGVVELWSVARRKLIANYKTLATGTVNCVAVSPNGQVIADGGQDSNSSGILEIWDASTGKALASPATACAWTVQFLSFSPDGKTLAVAGYPTSGSGYVIEFWNTKDWTLVTSYSSTGVINAMAFTPDSKTLLFNPGFALQALSVEYGVVFAQYAEAGFGTVAVSPLNDRIVTTSFNGEILAMADSINSVVWATGVTVSPGSFEGGSSATGTVTLSAPAPAGGLTLQLYVNVSGATVTYPSALVIPAGKTSATFTISSSSVTASATALVSVQGSGNFVTAQCSFTINP